MPNDRAGSLPSPPCDKSPLVALVLKTPPQHSGLYLFPICKLSGSTFSSSGQVLSYDNIKDIIKFCKDEKLVLLADEVGVL